MEVCQNCNCEYLNSEKKEIFLSKVSFNDKLPVSLWAFLILLFGAAMLISCYDFRTYIFIFRPKNLILGLLALVVSVMWIFSDLKNFKKRILYIKNEAAQSKNRCADQQYVDKLESLGYKK